MGNKASALFGGVPQVREALRGESLGRFLSVMGSNVKIYAASRLSFSAALMKRPVLSGGSFGPLAAGAQGKSKGLSATTVESGDQIAHSQRLALDALSQS